MTKITFEDLPSTNTPLSASNLNTLQDNVETAINGTISNTSGSSQTIGYSQEYLNSKMPETIWTGTLYGTETATLTGVKNKLKVYARSRNDSIIYEIDLTGEEYYTNYGSGQVVSYDTASSLEYYISESSYVRSTGVFTHVRTGYFNISNGTYTNRNKNQGSYSGYYVYKIETYN